MAVLGLTGPFGSGCTYISDRYLKPRGFHIISLSSILESHGGDASASRTEKQDLGNNLRKSHGPDFLARCAVEEAPTENTRLVFDSIRNSAEVECLRQHYGTNFYLIGIFANTEIRWKRSEAQYNSMREKFDTDEVRDRRDEDIEHGQQVDICFKQADIVLRNEDSILDNNRRDKHMGKVIDNTVALIEDSASRPPTIDEALMVMAYANSKRSSCYGRQVGALLVDDLGNIFSSGFNEVPWGEQKCSEEYGKCYRKLAMDAVQDKLTGLSDEQRAQVRAMVSEFRLLDQCRALHAEEHAILNAARLGSSLAFKGAKLYTTTYPCNLCANKIVSVGIREVEYFEAYPGAEAERTLTDAGVSQKAFEGVTYNGYFRLFGRRME